MECSWSARGLTLEPSKVNGRSEHTRGFPSKGADPKTDHKERAVTKGPALGKRINKTSCSALWVPAVWVLVLPSVLALLWPSLSAFGVFCLLMVLGLGPASFASCVWVVLSATTLQPLRTLDRYPPWPQGRHGVSVTEATRKQNVHAHHVVNLMQLIICLIPKCS